jgi:hypothetical protein
MYYVEQVRVVDDGETEPISLGARAAVVLTEIGFRRPGTTLMIMPQNKRKSSPVPMNVDGSSKGPRKEKADGEFRSVKASIVLAVPPVFANRLRDGVEEMLDSMIMR